MAAVLLGGGVLALGLGWVWLAWRQVVAERRSALAMAVTFGLIGAQLVVAGDTENQNYLGYALTAIVAGVCFAAYARIREWVVLAGATLVVPEFLYDVTGDRAVSSAGRGVRGECDDRSASSWGRRRTRSWLASATISATACGIRAVTWRRPAVRRTAGCVRRPAPAWVS